MLLYGKKEVYLIEFNYDGKVIAYLNNTGMGYTDEIDKMRMFASLEQAKEKMQKLRSLFLPDYHMSITKFILERDEFIMSC